MFIEMIIVFVAHFFDNGQTMLEDEVMSLNVLWLTYLEVGF